MLWKRLRDLLAFAALCHRVRGRVLVHPLYGNQDVYVFAAPDLVLTERQVQMLAGRSSQAPDGRVTNLKTPTVVPSGFKRYHVVWTLALVLLAGCTQTRTVTVELPPEPPSVVTRTDTVFVETPPEIVLMPGTPTVPETLVVYRQARTAPVGFELLALELDSTHLTLRGRSRDWVFRSPAFGETLQIAARADTLRAIVGGVPAPRRVQVDVPVYVVQKSYPPLRMLWAATLGVLALAILAMIAHRFLPR